jgi:hypothetical protein
MAKDWSVGDLARSGKLEGSAWLGGLNYSKVRDKLTSSYWTLLAAYKSDSLPSYTELFFESDKKYEGDQKNIILT